MNNSAREAMLLAGRQLQEKTWRNIWLLFSYPTTLTRRAWTAMERDIDALNDEIVAAGIGVFVGGLRPASEAKSLRAQPGGKVLVTDGPYLETKEHMGGFWIIEAASLDEAVEWARKGVVACRVPVEVRQVWRPDGN